VEYLRDGKLERAHAGEVVLSGGAVNSPHLLLLSGVGPQAQLKQHDLSVVADLPGVGQNLQDHPLSGVCHVCTSRRTLDAAEKSPLALLKYLLLRRGPLTSNVAEAGAFVRSDPALPAPDLQFHFAPAFYVEHGFVRPPGHGFSAGVCLLRPRSRGTVGLRSRDPRAAAAIQPRYLESAADLRLQALGVRLARRILRAAAFAPYRGPEYMPGAAVESDEDLERHIRERVETLYHPVGTCKMGADPLAVVDPQLRVYCTTGLRVVDASVMPTLVGGNTNAPTIMIAEKAADLIRGRCLPREDGL
jgi:choline dehydrogenase